MNTACGIEYCGQLVLSALPGDGQPAILSIGKKAKRDLEKWLIDIFTAAICGLVGGTLGAYFRGYFEEKGKHIATYEDVAFLLSQEREKAFEQEKGRRLATHEDIGHVLTEVRLVTKETETIRAQIGGDLWLRQTVWNQKRDAYKNIVGRSNEFQDALNRYSATRDSVNQHDNESSGIPVYLSVWMNESVNDIYGSHKALLNALTEAEIFLDDEAMRLIYECRRSSHLQTFREALNQKPTEEPSITLELMNYLYRWTAKLNQIAKKDLGVKPT